VWGSDVYDFPYESAFKGRLLRWNLRRASAVASTSHAMAQQVRRLTPERAEIAVTPFGVDLSHFAPAAPPRPRGPLTIGIVKTLARKYGVDLLLRAFAGLMRDADVQALRDACRLLVVGDGPQRAALEALARELGIAAQTEFAGAVAHADVPAWLNRLDLYAAPSRLDSESFGVAVIEAGACALPVVVSDAGGLPEVVRDGETGLVVPRDDVPALQAGLKRLVLDAALRDRLGRNGRAHVVREYEWGHCVDLMERAYARTMALDGRRW
jgi:L-malate glycosyltransferase